MKFHPAGISWALCAAVVFGLAGDSRFAYAATATLFPIADTTLHEAFPNNNFGDGTSFQAGGRRQGGRARGLVLFDIAGNLPAGSMITSVSLTFNVVAVPSGGINSIFDLNRLTSAWGEGNGGDHGGSPGGAGQATWNNRLGPGTPWASPGGDFVATISASRAIAGFGSYTFATTASLVADVQGWLNNPATEFGWLLRSESELTPTTIRRFGNRTDLANRPSLTIEYIPIPEPSIMSLAALALGVGAISSRRSRSG